MIDDLILGALTIRDMSGYEIKKFMTYSTAFFANVSYGSIYPTLEKFEENGLVYSKELVEKGRYKKVYEITEEGRKLFRDWMKEPLKPFVFRYEMLIRMFFARNIPKEDLIELIHQHLDQLQELLTRLDEVEADHSQGIDEFQMRTLRFGQDFYAFLSQWYRQLLEELESDTN